MKEKWENLAMPHSWKDKTVKLLKYKKGNKLTGQGSAHPDIKEQTY